MFLRIHDGQHVEADFAGIVDATYRTQMPVLLGVLSCGGNPHPYPDVAIHQSTRSDAQPQTTLLADALCCRPCATCSGEDGWVGEGKGDNMAA